MTEKARTILGGQIVTMMQTAKPTKGYDLGFTTRFRHGAVVRRVLFQPEMGAICMIERTYSDNSRLRL